MIEKAVTSVAVSAGAMPQETASVLVAAGACSVFLMPLLGTLTYRVADAKPIEAVREIAHNPHDISGILRDCADEGSLIRTVRVSEIPALYKDGVITGGMIPKVECCAEAVRRGVPKVFIIDGRVPHSIIVEMLTDEGLGTMFIK